MLEDEGHEPDRAQPDRAQPEAVGEPRRTRSDLRAEETGRGRGRLLVLVGLLLAVVLGAVLLGPSFSGDPRLPPTSPVMAPKTS